jgi:hypothetical protein
MIKIKELVLVVLTSLMFGITLIGQDPLFPNSVVSNDIDFILDNDPDTYTDLNFKGREIKEMPGDPNGGGLFDVGTYVFEAIFSDGERLEIWCHSSFGDQAAAQEYAAKLGPRLGKLPVFQRNMMDHIVIHNGNRGAFAEIEGQFFILYSENMDQRISTNDLEETVFHESVHASYQFMYQDHPDWTSAQAADPTFVTVYAQDNPFVEDIAESALFAYVYLTYPGRLSSDIEEWLLENIPNRLEFFGAFYSQATSAEDLEEKKKLTISPNPTNNQFTVTGIEKQQRNSLNVLDMHGKILRTVDCSNLESINIDLSDFNNGLYLFSIEGYPSVRILKFN